jgi:hypothetical protein
VKVSSGAESYKPALEKFSELLKQGDLGGLPEPRGDIGPIRKLKSIKRGNPAIKKHAVHVHQWEQEKSDDLKVELDKALLRDVFGLAGEDEDRFEKVLRSKIWA